MAGRVAGAGVFGERPCWLEKGRVGYGGFREGYVEVPRVNEVVAERGEVGWGPTLGARKGKSVVVKERGGGLE